MGTLSFLLPERLPAEATDHLRQAYVAGGFDSMPWPTEVRLADGRLTVRCDVNESGYLLVPWEVASTGRVMGATATLMERATPYFLHLELARGKVNQVRNQTADWRSLGLQVPTELDDLVREASRTFGRAASGALADADGAQAQAALNLGYQTGEELARTYIDQMFKVRHHRHFRLETSLGCRIGPELASPQGLDALLPACNSVCIPFCWKDVEPTEGQFRFDAQDALVDWAEERGLRVIAGPLIDFSPGDLPGWLAPWEGDLASLASFMCEYVGSVVQHYRGRVDSWHLTAASNYALVLGLGEDESFILTARVADAARQVEPGAELIVGIAQPWGDYMAQEDRSHPPFVFADNLVRSGLHLSALDLEWVMGVAPRGSYCRDLLEASRLLDLYWMLGVPLQVTLGYPAAAGRDPRAGPDLLPGAGHWRGGLTAEAQADWAGSFAAMALCKPFVRAVHWIHAGDAQPHYFPHCGLLDAQDNPRPALQRLRELREQHLR